MDYEAKALLKQYLPLQRKTKTLARRLRQLRRRDFGKCVTVKQGTCTILGIVVHEECCPPEKVPVLLPDGTTTWYEIGALKLVRKGVAVPEWTTSPPIRKALQLYRPLK